MVHSLLFVDDQVSLLEAMREFFLMRGFAVDCATELEEAQALIDCREYSLAICDVALKGVRDAEGLEVVSQIRSLSPQTRIIILTGCPPMSIRNEVLEWRVDRVLSKPQPLGELAMVVEQLLSMESPGHVHSS
ncbi:MAG: response regulator [Acidobacteriota bacterium]